jgi:small subunit ribosomal protein S1
VPLDPATAARLCQKQEAGEFIRGRIAKRLSKGFLVELADPAITAFLPGSQVDLRRPTDWESYLEMVSEFSIEVVPPEGSTEWPVVSRRAVLQAASGRKLESLTPGDRVHGTVKSLTSYGAFIDVDGLQGLLHRNEMSWGGRGEPADFCSEGQQLELVVLDVDLERQRLALSLKRLTQDPWKSCGELLVVGKRVEGTVKHMTDYGAFVEVVPGVDGLLHRSNISWTRRIKKPAEVLDIGQPLTCQVLKVDIVQRRLELGVKQLGNNPWEEYIPRTYPVGTVVDGTITNVVKFGVFVELEPDLEGLLHRSQIPGVDDDVDLPKDRIDVGRPVRVRVIEVDCEEQRIALKLDAQDTGAHD